MMHEILLKAWYVLHWLVQQVFPIGSFLTASAMGGYLFQYCQRNGIGFITRRLKIHERQQSVKTKAMTLVGKVRRRKTVVATPDIDALIRKALASERSEALNHHSRADGAAKLQNLIKQ